MNTKPIYLSRPDFFRLKALVRTLMSSGNRGLALQNLHRELNRATVVDPSTVAPTLVTLGAHVEIRDLDTDEREAYTVLLPQEVKPETDHISVLAPIGVALIGYSVGDEVAWQTPGGLRRFRIEAVTQPDPETRPSTADLVAQILGRPG